MSSYSPADFFSCRSRLIPRAAARLRHVPIETVVFSGLALTTLAVLALGLPMPSIR